MANNTGDPAAERSRDMAGGAIAIVTSVGIVLMTLFLFAMPLSGHMAGSRDFVSYWAAGHQLAQRANPYDREAISVLEHAAGLDARAVLVMRNPPWALVLAYPLGFLGVKLGATLWSLILLACLIASVSMVRRTLGTLPLPIHWPGFAFTPAILCFTMGQTSLFALLGLVLFLRFHASRPFAAGLVLWLCLLKPHLFLPFGSALCAWIVSDRAWRVLAGGFASLTVSSAVAWLIDPGSWTDYVKMMRSPDVANDFIPCLSDAARIWLWPQAIWLQYLPAILCSIWALIYFWRHRSHWNWTAHGGALMLVSLVVAPYCWLYDQCLAIPALLDRAGAVHSRYMITILAGLILIADCQLCLVKIISPLWLWTAPAWLVWFLFAGVSFAGRTRPAIT